MDRALYVGEKQGSHLYLPHRALVRCLERFGWKVDHLSPQEADKAALDDSVTGYDLVIWNGAIPERALAAFTESQIVVAMNGGGDDLSHYQAHRSKIAIGCTSLFYFDRPGPFAAGGRTKIRPNFTTAQALVYRYRFPKYAGPDFWQAMGRRLLYFPFMSDPEVFHPTGVEKDLKWCFVGHTRDRPMVEELERISRARGWNYEIRSPERKAPIDPFELNALYNRCEFGFNEHHRMHSGREINERGFDFGMVGCVTISDMGWLTAREHPFGRYYSSRIAYGREGAMLAPLFDEPPSAGPAEIHRFFRRYHSPEARIAVLSSALGVDLTKGHAKLLPGRAVWDGAELVPFVI
jgi:hypothetical protein